MRKVLTAGEMREVDRLTTERFGTPSLLLMEAAARAAFALIEQHFPDGLTGLRVGILCGQGNNGGDGAALGRLLALAGAQVEVVLFGSVGTSKGDARTNFELARSLAGDGLSLTETEDANLAGLTLHGNPNARLSFTECESAEAWERFLSEKALRDFGVIVDALFGTGLTRPLEGMRLDAVRFIQRERNARTTKRPLIVSLDIPSGLNADSATHIGEAVRADVTVTFTAPKAANVLAPARHFNGRLVVADIGSPTALIDESPSRLFLTESDEAKRWLVKTRYAPGSYKNTHGHALVIAGSRGMTGAAVLAGNAAMRAGAGLVTVATPASAQGALAARTMPEVMTAPLAETDRGAVSLDALEPVQRLMEKAQAVAIGPGLTSDDERTRRFVLEVVRGRRAPLVIDADGLNALAPWPKGLQGSTEAPLILTPHLGEMQRLLGTTEKEALLDIVTASREFAVRHQVILLLKGAPSLVASPDGRVFINPTGNAGLGTAGAGDTLTGIITGFLAQGYGTLKAEADALEAVLAALYLGGLAGELASKERGMRTMTASDIREQLGAAICSLDPEGERP